MIYYILIYPLILKQQQASLADVRNANTEHDTSSVSNSSRASSPDSQHRRDSRDYRKDSFGSAKSGGTGTPSSTPQTDYLLKQKELRERERQARENQVRT